MMPSSAPGQKPRQVHDLGYPSKVIANVRVNPKPEDLFDDCIPVYLEQRTYKNVGKYTVSGQFDFVGDGRVEDIKTTSAYSYTARNNDDKYILERKYLPLAQPYADHSGHDGHSVHIYRLASHQSPHRPKVPATKAIQRLFTQIHY